MGTFNSSKCKKSETQKEQVEMRNAEDWKDDVLSDVETELEALPFYPGVAYFVAFTTSILAMEKQSSEHSTNKKPRQMFVRIAQI